MCKLGNLFGSSLAETGLATLGVGRGRRTSLTSKRMPIREWITAYTAAIDYRRRLFARQHSVSCSVRDKSSSHSLFYIPRDRTVALFSNFILVSNLLADIVLNTFADVR